MPTFSLLPALVAVTLQVTTTVTGIFEQPPAVQVQPEPNQNQSHSATSTPNFYHLCMPVGRKCPNNYTSQTIQSRWIQKRWKIGMKKGERTKEKRQQRKRTKAKVHIIILPPQPTMYTQL